MCVVRVRGKGGVMCVGGGRVVCGWGDGLLCMEVI